ncbi:MAG: PadR family transcriptional regulator [Bacteroidota bacterium]
MKILGAFEELVLLAVGSLGDEAYGVAIKELLEEKGGKKPSIGALHSALYRLEDKGYLKSWVGGATAERGGRRKKYYQLTNLGKSTLEDAHQLRMELSRNIKGLNLGFNG